jgi:hypothetical protein
MRGEDLSKGKSRMKPSKRTVNRRRAAIFGSAAVTLAALIVAQGNVSASATSSGGPGVPDGSDSFQLMKATLGVPGMKNQEDLNAFKTWLIARPHVVNQGFYESAVDIAHRRMTLQWHGTSPLQVAAVAEGRRRGLRIVVQHVPYTRASVERATKLLLNPKNSTKIKGFRVTSVAGPTDVDSRLTVAGTMPGNAHPTATQVKAAAPALAKATKSLTGLNAAFVPGVTSVPYTTRSTDTSPFNAGGMMRGSDGNGCTSGFGIRRSGLVWTTTARHCDAASWTAWNLSSSSYGSRYTADAGTGARMLTGDGFYWMFDGAWNNSSGYHKTVSALADVSRGSSICSSGANSGVHCNLIVDNLVESFNDGYGSFSSIRVHASSGIAGAHGDSGGPMFIPNSDGTHVWAVGILQGSNEAQTSSCGSLRIATTCSAYVEFTSERVFLNNLGATLRTG